VHPIQVQDRDSAELSHRDREVDIDHAIHGGAPDWQRELEAIAKRKGDVDLVGIERDPAWHQGDLVESIRPAGPPTDSYLEARLLPGNHSAGFEPALIQGVFTPMVAGFAELYGMAVTSRGRIDSPLKMYRTLEYLRGITDDDVHRLRARGIEHTNQLLHRTSLGIDRERLTKRTGISTERLLEFAHQCTLLEVSGMERVLPIMRRFGINSMRDLRAQDARALHARLVDAVGLAGAPTFSDVQYWISQATALDIVEEPEPTPALPVVE
jgi:hypothetical protein